MKDDKMVLTPEGPPRRRAAPTQATESGHQPRTTYLIQVGSQEGLPPVADLPGRIYLGRQYACRHLRIAVLIPASAWGGGGTSSERKKTCWQRKCF